MEMNPQEYATKIEETKYRVAQELGIQFNVDGDNLNTISKIAKDIIKTLLEHPNSASI